MIVLRYKNRGKEVNIEARLNVTLDDIEWLVKNPNIDKVHRYNSKDECKANQNLIYWGDVLSSSNLIKGNYGKRCAIILDYDGGLLIDDYITKFNGKFKFYLYTSISHTSELHKFRVIIPTTESFDMNRHLKNVLRKCFPDTDPCSFDNRGFYEPVQINGYYGYFISEGAVFDLEKRLGSMVQKEQDRWVAEMKRIEADREAKRIEREAMGIPPASLEVQKNWTIENLDKKYGGCGSTKTGSRYIDLRSYCTALLKAEYWDVGGYMFDVDEVEDIIFNEYKDQAIVSMVRGMVSTLHR
jgi:hypothetical protein